MDDDDRLVLTPPGARVAITCSRPEFPEDDPRTVFGVAFAGPGLEAEVGIETLDGDGGARCEGRPSRDGEWIGLGRLFQDLGSSGPWEGPMSWTSHWGELTVTLGCSRRGLVTVEVTARDLIGQLAPWSVRSTFEIPLGDLAALGARVEAWFLPPYA